MQGAGGLKIPPKRMKRPGAKAKVPLRVQPTMHKDATGQFSSDEDEEPPPLGGEQGTCKVCN
jgi:hypothetical protein